jgi:hypothetical protein
VPELGPELFWRYIGDMYRAVGKDSPDGMQAIAEVELKSGRKFTPGVVQRYPPFLVFEVPGGSGKTEVLVVREDDLLSIHIYHGRQNLEKYPTGFAEGEVKASPKPGD